MRLFPSFGSLATADGRASWLSPPFGRAATSAPTFATLYDAVRAMLAAEIPALTAVWFLEVGVRPTATPYAILTPVNESPEWNTSGTSYAAWHQMQLTFVGGGDPLAAQTARDAAYRLLAPKKNTDGTQANPQLVFADGTLGPCGCLPGLKLQWKSDRAGPQGAGLWLFAFTARFYVSRPL